MEAGSQVFWELKSKLVMAPILAYPDPSRTFVLDTNASSVSRGTVLPENLDNEEWTIAYSSRTFTEGERQYCIIQENCLLWSTLASSTNNTS